MQVGGSKAKIENLAEHQGFPTTCQSMNDSSLYPLSFSLYPFFSTPLLIYKCNFPFSIAYDLPQKEKIKIMILRDWLE
jgi:hypothetical protein